MQSSSSQAFLLGITSGSPKTREEINYLESAALGVITATSSNGDYAGLPQPPA